MDSKKLDYLLQCEKHLSRIITMCTNIVIHNGTNHVMAATILRTIELHGSKEFHDMIKL